MSWRNTWMGHQPLLNGGSFWSYRIPLERMVWTSSFGFLALEIHMASRWVDDMAQHLYISKLHEVYMSNEKRAPGCLGYIGGLYYPVMWGLFHKQATCQMSNEEKTWLLRVHKGLYCPVTWGLFHKPWSKDPCMVYLHLHLVDFYGKCRYIYQSHGSYGL